MPPLSEEQKAHIAETVRVRGVDTPIVVWRDGNEWVLVDGHNRLEAWRAAREVDPSIYCPEVMELEADDEDEVCGWIIETHLNRRNLTAEQIHYYRGEIYNETKRDRGENLPKGQNDPLAKQGKNGQKRTSEEVAEKLGVGEKTVRRAGDFATGIKKLPPEERAEVLAGKSSRTKAEIESLGRETTPDPKPELSDKERELKDWQSKFTAIVTMIGKAESAFELLKNELEGNDIISLAMLDDFKSRAAALKSVPQGCRPEKHQSCNGVGCKGCNGRGFKKNEKN